jgi:hypothetical protein
VRSIVRGYFIGQDYLYSPACACAPKRASLMKFIKTAWIYIVLLSSSAFFLVIEFFTHTEFFLHLAAIPIEILLGALLVERYLSRKEREDKLRHLMYIKSYVFRAEMRNLFIANFKALKYPAIDMTKLKEANLQELKKMREDAEKIEYQSVEAMEPVIMEYVNSREAFYGFMQRAINCNFESIFQNMIYVLHFIQDVKLFKDRHPDKLFIHEAQRQLLLMEKVNKVLGDGIKVFIDYMIELKVKQPDIMYELLTDYEISSRIAPGNQD